MPVVVKKKETRMEIVVPMPGGYAFSMDVTLFADTQDQDAEFVKKMVEYADGTADKLRQQNRELKDALLHESSRRFYDEREKIELDFPEL